MQVHRARTPVGSGLSLIGAVLAACILLPAGPVQAQGDAASFPSRTIRIVVPYAAGGGTDTVARLLAPRMQEKLGRPVVVENRGGAGSRIGSDYVAKAEPDGYTLLYSSNGSFVIVPHTGPTPYDSLKDFAPITLVARADLVFAANPKVPANNMAELVALAKREPGKLNYGTSGTGGPGHLAGEQLNRMAGISLVHVPYKGTGESNTAVVSGAVDLTIAGMSGVGPLIQAGRVKALGLSGPKPSPAMPGVAPVGETVKGYENTLWYGLVAPAKTPRAIIDKLHAAAVAAASDKAVIAAIERDGAVVETTTPEAFAAVIARDHAAVGEMVRAIGIKE